MTRPETDSEAVGGTRRRRSAAREATASAVVHCAVHQIAQDFTETSPCRVLDVGGGSGVWAVPLAELGAQVTVVDPSPDALASLARRAREAGVAQRVVGVQGDVDCLGDLLPGGAADLVLAHGVLEVVDDPARAMVALVSALAPGGVLSVLAAGKSAAVLHRALLGRVHDALHVLADPLGRVGPDDALLRRFDVNGLTALFTEAGLEVELVQGDAVVSDLMASSALDTAPENVAGLAELESAASRALALREIASRLHAVGRLPALS